MPPDPEQIKQQILRRRKPASPIPAKDFLSTGSTLLNLACTGKVKCGIAKGTYCPLIGDSGSGKTWLGWSMFAEACQNPAFDGYHLEFDDIENGSLMDVARYFGARAKKRVKVSHSPSLEAMYDRCDDLVSANKPFVLFVDSMDALVPRAFARREKKNRTAREKGREEAGSYGDGKAKINSQRLRTVTNHLPTTGSILVVVCQTRDNIGFGAQFNPKTRGGGHAITFYASLEVWCKIVGKVKTRVRDKDVEQGSVCRFQVKKNRVVGSRRHVDVPILHSHGIDETGSLVDWLVEWGVWKEARGVISAPELELECRREKLVEQVESDGLLPDLQILVSQEWSRIEEASAVNRKPRYA